MIVTFKDALAFFFLSFLLIKVLLLMKLTAILRNCIKRCKSPGKEDKLFFIC